MYVLPGVLALSCAEEPPGPFTEANSNPAGSGRLGLGSYRDTVMEKKMEAII